MPYLGADAEFGKNRTRRREFVLRLGKLANCLIGICYSNKVSLNLLNLHHMGDPNVLRMRILRLSLNHPFD